MIRTRLSRLVRPSFEPRTSFPEAARESPFAAGSRDDVGKQPRYLVRNPL
jgi:hypothetical protein